jgi:hypothetical protein
MEMRAQSDDPRGGDIMRRRLLTIAWLIVPAASAAAQTSPITVLMGPAPNQTLHLRATEVVDLTIEAEPAQPPMPALERRQTHVTVSLELTSTVGPADDRGRYEARVVCDRAASTTMINGNPVPTSNLKADEMVGRAFTIRYGEHNEFRTLLAEVAPDPDIAGFTELVTDALVIAMPPALSVGETVTVQGALSLARPATYGYTDTQLIPTGNTRHTLNAITFDGADRIAHLTMKSSGTVTFASVTPIPGAGPPASITVQVRGDGTSEVNLDRGLVLSHEQRVTTETSRQVEGRSAAPRRASSTVTLTVERIP